MNLNFGSMRNSVFVWVLVLLVAAVTFGAVTRWKTNGAQLRTADTVLAAAVPVAAPQVERNPERNAYFGETHQHTSWSFDAYIFGNHLTGLPTLTNIGVRPSNTPLGYDTKIETPLDFPELGSSNNHSLRGSMGPALL